jgi:hypothetical protein
MRDIHKMCRICLNQGSRDIFEHNNLGAISSRDDLSRIAEKLRYVTMLKVSKSQENVKEIKEKTQGKRFRRQKLQLVANFLSFCALFSLFYSKFNLLLKANSMDLERE